MLRGLVWRFISPYRHLVAAVITLQTISTMATLCLPTINAAIIDDGVIKGDTSTVVRLGAIMFAVGGLQIVCAVGAVYVGSRSFITSPGSPQRKRHALVPRRC
jgi:ABC-type multidrug transport system fused ATPase/permease subunit